MPTVKPPADTSVTGEYTTTAGEEGPAAALSKFSSSSAYVFAHHHHHPPLYLAVGAAACAAVVALVLFRQLAAASRRESGTRRLHRRSEKAFGGFRIGQGGSRARPKDSASDASAVPLRKGDSEPLWSPPPSKTAASESFRSSCAIVVEGAEGQHVDDWLASDPERRRVSLWSRTCDSAAETADPAGANPDRDPGAGGCGTARARPAGLLSQDLERGAWNTSARTDWALVEEHEAAGAEGVGFAELGAPAVVVVYSTMDGKKVRHHSSRRVRDRDDGSGSLLSGSGSFSGSFSGSSASGSSSSSSRAVSTADPRAQGQLSHTPSPMAAGAAAVASSFSGSSASSSFSPDNAKLAPSGSKIKPTKQPSGGPDGAEKGKGTETPSDPAASSSHARPKGNGKVGWDIDAAAPWIGDSQSPPGWGAGMGYTGGIATETNYYNPPLPPLPTGAAAHPFETTRRPSVAPALNMGFLQLQPDANPAQPHDPAGNSSRSCHAYTNTRPSGIPPTSASSSAETMTPSSSSSSTFSPVGYPPNSPLAAVDEFAYDTWEYAWDEPQGQGQYAVGGGHRDAYGNLDVQEEILPGVDDDAGHGGGWMRHTRVYGGGECLACAASGGEGGFYGARVPAEQRVRR